MVQLGAVIKEEARSSLQRKIGHTRGKQSRCWWQTRPRERKEVFFLSVLFLGRATRDWIHVVIDTIIAFISKRTVPPLTNISKRTVP